jgi:hypothetical protein
VVDAGPLVEVHDLRPRHDVAVAEPVDLVAEPGGGLGGVPVQREVALEEDLVRGERLGREVFPDPPEHHVEVAVPPEVVAGQLRPEDLAEGGPEVAQLVRALQRDLEREVALEAGDHVRELAPVHRDVGRCAGDRPVGEQEPVDVGVVRHAPDDEGEVRRARAEVRDDQPHRGRAHRPHANGPARVSGPDRARRTLSTGTGVAASRAPGQGGHRR